VTDLSRSGVLSFEVLGTLLDWDLGLAEALSREAGVSRPAQIRRLLAERREAEWRIVDQATEFRPYREVLANSLREAAARCGNPLSRQGAARIAASLGHWPLFSDVAEILPRLAQGRRLALVSNVDRDDLTAIARRLGAPVARMVTAADLEIYKPAPELLLALMHELQLDEDELLHISSSPDLDLYTAEDLGVPAVFLDRLDEGAPEDLTVVLRVGDLATLADKLKPLHPPAPRRSAGNARRPGAGPGVARRKRPETR
jgi:2-haloalkanoic acid dehalogenase type II